MRKKTEPKSAQRGDLLAAATEIDVECLAFKIRFAIRWIEQRNMRPHRAGPGSILDESRRAIEDGYNVDITWRSSKSALFVFDKAAIDPLKSPRMPTSLRAVRNSRSPRRRIFLVGEVPNR